MARMPSAAWLPVAMPLVEQRKLATVETVALRPVDLAPVAMQPPRSRVTGYKVVAPRMPVKLSPLAVMSLL